MARGVVCIFLNGNRKAYTSVAETARELQISKDGVRKACERRCQLRGVWFKYSGDRDAATSPAPSEKAHWNVVVVPDDAASVTRSELGVILLGMAGGLGTAAFIAPGMAWALVPVAVLVPLELALSGAAHRDLMASRAAAPATGTPP